MSNKKSKKKAKVEAENKQAAPEENLIAEETTEEPAVETSETEEASEMIENTEAAVEETAPAETGDQPEEPAEAPVEETEYSAAEGTDASLLSEFAPKPMNIPNVNLEREKKRQERREKKRDLEKKKVEARKNRHKKAKRSTGQKIAAGIACFVLFMVMSVTMTAFISSLTIQAATSRYAFRLAVDNMDVAEITIGSPDYRALRDSFDMDESSGRAALVDMIRDNSNVLVTYGEIVSGIEGSGVESFLETQLKSAVDHLLLDKPYTPMTGEDIANVVKNSATLVRNLTGRILTDEDYSNIAAYFESGGKLDDVSIQAVESAQLRKYTPYTRNLLSLNILGALLLINILLIVLLVVLGRNSAHIPIGWAFIVSGIAVVVGGILFKPSHAVTSGFLQTVLNQYFSFFTMTVVIIAGIFAVVGALIFLIGNAANDRDE